MMQDLPWVLPEGAKVSFTCLDASFYSPVKNARTDAIKKSQAGGASGGAAEGEHAVYDFNARILRLAGCALPPPATASTGGVPVAAGPRVVLGASFRPTVGAAVKRLAGGGAISLTARSTLLVEGDVTIHSLHLDGALHVKAAVGAKLTIHRLSVRNAGCAFRELSEDEQKAGGKGASEVNRLRGYVYDDVEVAELTASAGEHNIDEGSKPLAASTEPPLVWRTLRAGPQDLPALS